MSPSMQSVEHSRLPVARDMLREHCLQQVMDRVANSRLAGRFLYQQIKPPTLRPPSPVSIPPRPYPQHTPLAKTYPQVRPAPRPQLLIPHPCKTQVPFQKTLLTHLREAPHQAACSQLSAVLIKQAHMQCKEEGTAKAVDQRPAFIIPPSFIGHQSGASTAPLTQQQGSKPVLAAVAVPKQAPKESPSLTFPGGISFYSSSTAPTLAPQAHLLNRLAPAPQPVSGFKSTNEVQGAPNSAPGPGTSTLSSSGSAQQTHLSSSPYKAENRFHGSVVTQDIGLPGTSYTQNS